MPYVLVFHSLSPPLLRTLSLLLSLLCWLLLFYKPLKIDLSRTSSLILFSSAPTIPPQVISSSPRALHTFYTMMIPKFISPALTSPLEIHAHISNHLLNSSPCIPNRHLKMNMFKTELLISSSGHTHSPHILIHRSTPPPGFPTSVTSPDTYMGDAEIYSIEIILAFFIFLYSTSKLSANVIIIFTFKINLETE